MTNELLSLDYLLKEDAGQAFGVRRTVTVTWPPCDKPEPPYHNQVRFSTWTKESDEQYMDIYVHEEDNKLHFRAIPNVFWELRRRGKQDLLNDPQLVALVRAIEGVSFEDGEIHMEIEQTQVDAQTDAKVSAVILDICRAANYVNSAKIHALPSRKKDKEHNKKIGLHSLLREDIMSVCRFADVEKTVINMEPFVVISSGLKSQDGRPYTGIHVKVIEFGGERYFYITDNRQTFVGLAESYDAAVSRLSDPRVVDLVTFVKGVFFADLVISMTFPCPPDNEEGKRKLIERIFDFYRALDYANSAMPHLKEC